MSIEAKYILGAIAIGIGATLVMDLWNQFLKRQKTVSGGSSGRAGR